MREAYNLYTNENDSANTQPRSSLDHNSQAPPLSIHIICDNPPGRLYIIVLNLPFPFQTSQHKLVLKLLAESLYSYALCRLDKHQLPSQSGIITMETDDSSMEKYFALLKQQKLQLKEAQAYKGQTPPASIKRSRSALQQEFYLAV